MTNESSPNGKADARDSISRLTIDIRMDNVLNSVILIILILTILALVATIFLYQRKLASALFFLALIMTMMLAKFLMQRGQVQTAGVCAVSGVWLITSVFLFLGGGLDSINVIYFVSLTVWAGLILGTKATLIVAGLTMALGLGLVSLSMQGLLPSPYFFSTPLTEWLQLVFALILTASTLNIALRNRDKALAMANQQLAERLEAESALRESENKYRLITEKMSDIVWMADMNLKTTYVTPSVQTVLGFTQEERMKQTVDQQFTAESLSIGMEAMAREMALNGTGEANPARTAKLVLEYCHKDGTTRWMETVMTGLRDDYGTLIGLHGVSRDVTERKKAEEALQASEERYRTIFENTATANIIVADDSTITMANNNFVRLSGYTKQDLEGKLPWTAFIHPDDLEKMKEYHNRRRIDTASAPSSYEFRFINRRGEIRNLFLTVAVIPETNDSVASMVDLTGRKQLETQLIQAQKMESIGRLAGGVAHDFNNMLSVIIGNAEMAIKRITPSDPVHKSLKEILNAGMRSSDLTRQLLAFARKQTVSPKVLDLNDTVSGMLKMLRRLIGEDIDLAWHPGANLWKVKIDPSQVDQMLANLSVNARDAIEKSGSISLETANILFDTAYCSDRPDCMPGEYVMLAVSDNGCGMDKETLANIFEPFFTTKAEGHGTGLGLATVYGIIKQNGGFVHVGSEPGKGTTFRLYLPRHLDTASDDTGDQPSPEIPRGSETILIVEDEETVLSLSAAMLKMLGYRVITAKRADQALRLVTEYNGKIDLLLTDVVMPDMNGKQLSEKILALKPDLKCLYMSGYTADVIARQGILEEGIEFISKPFSLKDLATKIREILG